MLERPQGGLFPISTDAVCTYFEAAPALSYFRFFTEIPPVTARHIKKPFARIVFLKQRFLDLIRCHNAG